MQVILAEVILALRKKEVGAGLVESLVGRFETQYATLTVVLIFSLDAGLEDLAFLV